MNHRRLIISLQVAYATLLLVGVFALLPARWAPVDVGALIAGGAMLFAAASSLMQLSFAKVFTQAVATLTLVTALALFTALAFTAGDLAGKYGPVGMGGSIILILVAALIVPYLAGIPAMVIYLSLPKATTEDTP